MRALIREIVVDIDEQTSEVALLIHWKGGVHTSLRLPRRRRGESGGHTPKDVVEAVRVLSRIYNDEMSSESREAAHRRVHAILRAWRCDRAPLSERSSRRCAARAHPAHKHEQLLSREREIEHLKLLLIRLHRMQFGRKSEKLARQIEQLELRLEELKANCSEKEAPPEPTSLPATVRLRPRRSPHAALCRSIYRAQPAGTSRRKRYVHNARASCGI